MMTKDILFWVMGILSGVVWSLLNMLFISLILKKALIEKRKKGILFVFLLKFVFLYTAGFLLLKSHIFDPLSLLLGLGFGIFLFGVIKNVSTYAGSSARTP